MKCEDDAKNILEVILLRCRSGMFKSRSFTIR